MIQIVNDVAIECNKWKPCVFERDEDGNVIWRFPDSLLNNIFDCRVISEFADGIACESYISDYDLHKRSAVICKYDSQYNKTTKMNGAYCILDLKNELEIINKLHNVNDMEALQKLGTIVPSKENQAAMIKSMVEAVVVGDTNPIEAEVFVTFLEGLCKEYRKNENVKNLVKDTLEENGGKIDTDSAKVTLVKTKVYDYLVSAKYRELDAEGERIKELKKSIEEALKNASDLTPFNDPLDGTIITIPPIDQERVSVRVVLNKEA